MSRRIVIKYTSTILITENKPTQNARTESDEHGMTIIDFLHIGSRMRGCPDKRDIVFVIGGLVLFFTI
jgi:hypothetical protein